jgi:drug/metabolite transporter (DMT)-like permease
LLITMSLPRLPAALTSLLLMIQPIGSLILGAIIFGENPSVLQLLGVLIVLGAVIFATRRSVAANGTGPASALSVAARRPDRPPG